MEGRLVLSASGFAGNECAPELNDTALDAIVPSQAVSTQTAVTFQFSAADVVSDAGVGATAPADILFALDPDIGLLDNVRDNGATPQGALLSLNDQGTTAVADDTWDFSWTPRATQVGTFRFFLIATDAGGTGNAVPLSDVYAFEVAINNQPSVDLNGADQAGVNSDAVSFTEADNSTPVNVVDTDLFIFSSNGTVESATVEIVNPQADGLESLGITAGTSLVVDSSTPGKLVLTVAGGGSASQAVFEDALKSLTYNNTSDSPEATRTINVSINDGTQESGVATATVNIQAVNDAPDLRTVPGAPAAVVGEEYVLNLTATDPDSSDLLVFRITSGPAGAVISPNGLTDNSSDNTIQVAPDVNGLYRAQIRWTPTTAQGDADSALFIVVVTDTGGLADPELYDIGIENNDPVANDDPSAQGDPLAVGEDAAGTVLGDILANDTDPDGDTFTVNSVLAGGSTFDVGVTFTHPTSGAAISVAANGQVNYNPNGQFESLGMGESTTDTFQYTVVDEKNNVSGEATVTVTINGANDAPTATSVVPEFSISEAAGATEIALATLLTAVTDVDAGDTHTVVSAPDAPAAGGVFTLDGGILRFNPNGEFSVDNGAQETADFTVTLQDSAGERVTVPARILIGGVNDAPVAVNDSGYSTDEDTPLNVSTRETGVLVNDTDDAGNAGLTVAQVNGDSANVGTAIMVSDGSGRQGELTVNSDGTFTFDPQSGFDALAVGQSSSVTFTYVATDSASENAISNSATVTITVNGLNDTPVANNVAGAAVEDGPAVNVDFDGEDADNSETANLTYAATSTPSAGTVQNNDDGTFTFDPGGDFQDLAEGITRDVTFNYTATDAQAAVSDAAIATITVTGVNDIPVFDLDNTDGLSSVLPTGDLQAGVVTVELDVSSTNADVNSLNNLELSSFTSDVDGDTVLFSLAAGDNGGTPFRNVPPAINTSNQLVWAPTAADVGTGYIVRVFALDQPGGGSSFDIGVSVISSPLVESVTPNIEVSLDASEVTILFDRAMGASAFEANNYRVLAADGVTGIVGTIVPFLSVTPVSGNNGVVLVLNDPTITSISAPLAGGTKLRLTLDPSIADLDGKTLEGPLEFDIDLITNATT